MAVAVLGMTLLLSRDRHTGLGCSSQRRTESCQGRIIGASSILARPSTTMPKNAILSDSRLGLQEPMTKGSLQSTVPWKSRMRADGSPQSWVSERNSVEELPLKFEGESTTKTRSPRRPALAKTMVYARRAVRKQISVCAALPEPGVSCAVISMTVPQRTPAPDAIF